jgi:alkaline phosphatase
MSLLPNNDDDDRPFAAASSATPLPYDPDGIDPEDLRVLPGGDLLLVDEYRPSVIAVDGATGQVRARLVPAGESLPGAGYPVAATLPAVLARRQRNAGFEGVALSSDGHTAYAVLQAPLGEAGASRIVRILRLSIADPTTPGAAGGAIAVTGDFVYRETAASAFPAGTAQRDVSISAAAWLGPDRLLLLERASGETKLVAVDLSASADIHGAAFENTLTPETGDLAALGVTPASGTPVFSSRELPALDGEKLEGLAILGRATVALSHDNDYGMDDARDATRIWIVRLGGSVDR